MTKGHKCDYRKRKTYDIIEETENVLVEAKAKKKSILAEKVCRENIYKALIFFDKGSQIETVCLLSKLSEAKHHI